MKITVTRDAAVLCLIDNVLESIHQDPTDEVLRSILRYGFPGFEKMSDRQLNDELELRGLSDARRVRIEDDDELEGAELDAGELEIGELAAGAFLRDAALDGD